MARRKTKKKTNGNGGKYSNPKLWDWGPHDPARCGQYTVGFLRPGQGYRVWTCHRERKVANQKLRERQQGLRSLASKIAKGVKFQVRNKETGKVVYELPVVRK
jgi:hypothetical protein